MEDAESRRQLMAMRACILLDARLAIAKENFETVKLNFEDKVVECNETVRASNFIMESTFTVERQLKLQWYTQPYTLNPKLKATLKS
jgi:hypothetical protein